MPEYIDRQKLYEAGENAYLPECYLNDPKGAYAWQGQKFKELILTAPAEDVAPVKVGKWEIRTKNKFSQAKWCFCSVCNGKALSDGFDIYTTNYCPRCGAKMED